MVAINRYFGLRVFMVIFTMVALAMAMKTGEPTNPVPPGGGSPRASAAVAAATVATGNCSCGGFATDTPATGAQPLIAQSPLTVPCTPAGGDTCRSMCAALAAATKAKGPEILCTRLVNATELKLAAFFKVCEEPWSYSGMQAEEALCCADSLVTQCAPAALVTVAASPADFPASALPGPEPSIPAAPVR